MPRAPWIPPDPWEIVHGIFAVLRHGSTERALLHDFPPWDTVGYSCRRWRGDACTTRCGRGCGAGPDGRPRPVPPSGTARRSQRPQQGNGAPMRPNRGTGANGLSWGTRGDCGRPGPCLRPPSRSGMARQVRPRRGGAHVRWAGARPAAEPRLRGTTRHHGSLDPPSHDAPQTVAPGMTLSHRL